MSRPLRPLREIEEERHAARGSTPFQGIAAASLFDRRIVERPWTVPHWIPRRQVTLLSGHGGTGKTLLALQLLVAHATDLHWLDQPCATGPCFGLFCEDDLDEVHRRLNAILEVVGRKFEDLPQMQISAQPGGDVVLFGIDANGKAGPSEKWTRFEIAVRQQNAKLIVIDSAADVFDADEIKRAHVRQFIRMLRSLALELDAAIVLLVHPSRTGIEQRDGISGSTAWANSARSVLVLEDDCKDKPDHRKLRRSKGNYAARGAEVVLRYEDGCFVAEAVPSSTDRRASEARVDRVFLNVVTNLIHRGVTLSPNKGPTYAPARASDQNEAEGISSAEFARAMDRLVTGGKLLIIPEGSPSRRRDRLKLASQ